VLTSRLQAAAFGARPASSARFAWPLAICAALLAGGCARTPEVFQGRTMGTTYSVVVTRLPAGVARADLASAIDETLAEVNRHLSTWDPTSEISAFNASRSTAPVPVSPPLGRVVAISEEVATESGGAFDVTVGPLVRAWGFGTDAPAAGVPDEASLAALRLEIGHDKLVLAPDERSLRKRLPGLEIDVAAVAPGYAVDLIAGRFDALGVRDYLVELGGELRARGLSPEGRPWRVAVEAPLRGERKPYALVELDGMSASTSGDYRDFRVVGGQRYSHTIDPRSGRPITHDLASVCVVQPSAAYADAWATALMVLGPEEGLALARRRGLAALFIERDPASGTLRERATDEFQRLRRPLD
jgi:thiamine biosynthesis lipoprotein